MLNLFGRGAIQPLLTDYSKEQTMVSWVALLTSLLGPITKNIDTILTGSLGTGKVENLC